MNICRLRVFLVPLCQQMGERPCSLAASFIREQLHRAIHVLDDFLILVKATHDQREACFLIAAIGAVRAGEIQQGVCLSMKLPFYTTGIRLTKLRSVVEQLELVEQFYLSASIIQFALTNYIVVEFETRHQSQGEVFL